MVPGIENEMDTLYELFGSLEETELLNTDKYRAALKKIEQQFKKQDEIIEELDTVEFDREEAAEKIDALETRVQEKDREIDSLRAVIAVFEELYGKKDKNFMADIHKLVQIKARVNSRIRQAKTVGDAIEGESIISHKDLIEYDCLVKKLGLGS